MAGIAETELAREFAGMKASGWQITEEPIEGDAPYNTRVIGWRVTARRNGVIIREEAPYRSQARAQVYERVREEA